MMHSWVRTCADLRNATQLITMERVEAGEEAEPIGGSQQLPEAPEKHVGGLAKPVDPAQPTRLRANADRTEFRNQVRHE